MNPPPHEALLGRIVTLKIRRFGPPGAFFALDEGEDFPGAPVLLLPRSEVPAGAKEGDALPVFVYLDSDDRPIATLRDPRLALGEVTFLEVTAVAPFGAFVDWGLPKELLVPRAEQTRPMHVGERHPIGLYIDDTGRLAGTMKVSEMLRSAGDFTLDEWVSGEAYRKEPDLGVFVILEQRFLGLVPASEPTALVRGDRTQFRIANILPDGKLELSLRKHGHEEVLGDAERVLAHLREPGASRIGDRSSPEEIRSLFRLSKKAFKRAVGGLLKKGAVTLDAEGMITLRKR
jgi:hypothetical protein